MTLYDTVIRVPLWYALVGITYGVMYGAFLLRRLQGGSVNMSGGDVFDRLAFVSGFAMSAVAVMPIWPLHIATVLVGYVAGLVMDED